MNRSSSGVKRQLWLERREPEPEVRAGETGMNIAMTSAAPRELAELIT